MGYIQGLSAYHSRAMDVFWREHASLAPIAASLLWRAGHGDLPESLLDAALPQIVEAMQVKAAVVVAAAEGRWQRIAESGAAGDLPWDWFADVLDRELPAVSAEWAAVPLAPRTAGGQVLAVRGAGSTEAKGVLDALAALAPVVFEAMSTVARRAAGQRRIRQLEAVLEIAHQWNRTRELGPLLEQMAQAATKLFAAERASIFLWDRPAHELVGRPALGVEGGELRVPDDRGVVGQVVQTGRPLRVDSARQPDAVDHHVDKRTGFQTRTLLCVPLRSARGDLFGAFELLNKRAGGFTIDDEAGLIELAAHAAIALENTRDRERLLLANRQMTEQAAADVQFIGRSPAIEALRSIVSRVADTDLAVLILGENGTGKEVVARSIHYGSRRRRQPFIAVNCAAIPDQLAESELFGHEKGAFTDAHEARPGKFELASGGTLLLDEIGDLSLGGQAKLLRVLEERTLVRVGGSRPIHTDVRVLAATNQNPADMVRAKRFREDLYFRLNVVSIELPPLRERYGDVMLLADHFLTGFCRRAHRSVPDFTPQARTRLENHPWPGNVRELRNLMERIAYLSTGDRVDVDELAFTLSPRGQDESAVDANLPLAEATAQFQTNYIRRAVELAGGNMSRAADQLGLHRSNLYRKMHQLEMDPPG